MSLKVIRNEISAVQQELLLKLEIKSIAMLEYMLFWKFASFVLHIFTTPLKRYYSTKM